ncbi:MAG: BatA domain-containing protein [Planctomycetaceae bacterium]
MTFGFLNLLMLGGLAGVALPVVVHLISRRKYDVVSWGAMQFLEVGRRTRRRIRLEELLLLLLRIGLICLLALALARPWAKGGWFSKLSRSTPRDVAVVIDGSYSMGWEGDAVTPHAAAIQRTFELLEELATGDTVTLLDARDKVRPLIERPTTDFRLVREQLDALPSPSGTSSVVSALTKAAQLLTTGEHLDHDIILMTDAQRLSWSPEDERSWRRFDETISQSSIPPHVWVVDVGMQQTDTPTNFSVDRLQLSRDLTVPGFPLRIEAKVRQWGGKSTTCEVHFAINGQRRSDKSIALSLPPNGEANVVFEHRFETVGSYVVSVSLDADDLPGDNQSDAAIDVAEGIPVLLVDGNLHRDRTQSETFFLHAALTPSGSDAPWVVASVIDAAQLTEAALEQQRVVFLANVSQLTETQIDLLERFVSHGGGLVIAAGDHVDIESYNDRFFAGGKGLLPARFDIVRNERDFDLGDVNVETSSLEASWLTRFRRENGVDFTEARFAHWWKLIPATTDDSTEESDMDPGPPLIVARFDTGDPFLVTHAFGEGTVVQLAAPLDSDWSTLPAKNDFVPFLHEIVFHLASRTSGRNVEPGIPLMLGNMNGTAHAETVEFTTPDGRKVPAEEFGIGPQARLGLSDTSLPGLYRAQPTDARMGNAEYFVVHSDRHESDLAPLSPPEQQRLSDNHHIQFVTSLEDIIQGMAEEEAPSELWRLLLLGVLLLLVAEVLMTRRLVQGGHEAIESPSTQM